MKLYRYWAVAEQNITDAEGEHLHLRKWGGSNDTQADAENKAKLALGELARRLMERADRFATGEYTYSNRDLPEELIEQIDDKNGITRNRYGCLVLNSANLLIADVDFQSPGFFGKLFGRKTVSEASALAHLKGWLAEHPNAGVRVYRTAKGLRYLLANTAAEPNEIAFNVLKELGSDRLYIFLCREQKSFRARLTPKPWRMSVERPPSGFFPAKDEQATQTFRTWLDNYEGKARGYATCRFVSHLGNQTLSPSLQTVIKRHDDLSGASSTRPLA
jgi:hypothetical protein